MVVVSGTATVLALPVLDVAGFYQGLFASMGTPEAEISEMVTQMTAIYGDVAPYQIVTAIATLLLLAFLFWARRHFRQIP